MDISYYLLVGVSATIGIVLFGLAVYLGTAAARDQYERIYGPKKKKKRGEGEDAACDDSIEEGP